jgi:hypothetical protein
MKLAVYYILSGLRDIIIPPITLKNITVSLYLFQKTDYNRMSGIKKITYQEPKAVQNKTYLNNHRKR